MCLDHRDLLFITAAHEIAIFISSSFNCQGVPAASRRLGPKEISLGVKLIEMFIGVRLTEMFIGVATETWWGHKAHPTSTLWPKS